MIGFVVRSYTLNEEALVKETKYFCVFFFSLIKRSLRGSLWEVEILAVY